MNRHKLATTQTLSQIEKLGHVRLEVGIELDKRIARTHNAILSEGEVVGEVTSGTRSPSSGRNIALGYVPRQLSRVGTPLEIDIRGKRAPARVVKSPFYSREA